MLTSTFLGNTLESYLWFFGILLGGFLLKKVISSLLSRVIYALFNRYGKTVGVEKFFGLMNRPFQFFIMVVILYVAFDRLEFPLEWNLVPENQFGVRLVAFKIFEALILFSFVWILVRGIDFIGLVMLERAKRTESKMDDQLVPFVKEAIKVIVASVGFLILVGIVFDLDIVSLVTGLGIGGLAFALAAKETLENLLGSFTLFLDKPFIVGDTVKVGTVEGKVESIGFRSTRIRALDRMLVVVPNKKMVDAELINDTVRLSRRSSFLIGLSYKTTEETMRNVLQDIRQLLHEHSMIEPDPTVRFRQFSPSSLDISIIFFVLTPQMDEFLKVQEEINFKILSIVTARGAEFAYPSTTVYLKQ